MFNFVKAESSYSMYEYKRTTFVKNFVSFNFVKHWPMRNLFNDEIFRSTVPLIVLKGIIGYSDYRIHGLFGSDLIW